MRTYAYINIIINNFTYNIKVIKSKLLINQG